MTATITYKNAYYNDMDNAAEWGAEHLVQMAAADASISSDGDILTMTGVTDDVAQQEYFYHELDVTNFYSNYVSVRFTTDHAAAGLAAKIQIVYDDADSQDIVLGYSQTWKTTTTALDHPAKAVDKIIIYAYEDLAANPNGTAIVYYDWILFHTGTFTFPHVAPGGVQVNLPVNIAKLQALGRNGAILQKMGQDSFEITVRGDCLEGETWRSSSVYPEFDYLLTSLWKDTWCYFTCDRPLIKCQVMYQGLTYEISGENMKMQYVLHFYGYKLGDYDTFSDNQWLWGL